MAAKLNCLLDSMQNTQVGYSTSIINLAKLSIPVRLIGKGHMPLPAFQPLTESRHPQVETHLVSVKEKLSSSHQTNN